VAISNPTYEIFKDSDGTWSSAATVPANTDCVIAVLLGYDSGVPGVTSISLGGAAMTLVTDRKTNEYYSVLVYRLKANDTGWSGTGAKTFACVMSSGAFNAGGIAQLFYLSGVDQTTPVRDSVACDTWNYGSGASTATQGFLENTILTTVSGDMCIIAAIADNTPDVDLQSQTKLQEDASAYNSAYSSAAYKTASGVSTTMDTVGDYVSAGCLSLIPAASATESLGWLTDGQSNRPLPHHLDKGVYVGY
jgi:hypothetical protein